MFCYPCGENKTFACCFVRTIQEQLARLAGIVCKYRGHSFDLVGSIANTETGQEHFECIRCGYYHSHIYY